MLLPPSSFSFRSFFIFNFISLIHTYTTLQFTETTVRERGFLDLERKARGFGLDGAEGGGLGRGRGVLQSFLVSAIGGIDMSVKMSRMRICVVTSLGLLLVSLHPVRLFMKERKNIEIFDNHVQRKGVFFHSNI